MTLVLMKRILFLLPALFFFVSFSSAQLLNARLITSIYTWEKFDTVDVSKKFARGVQSVFLDLTQGDFGIYTHVQGAASLQSQLDEVPDFRAYHLYARWRNVAGMADVSFGRLPFFAGVGSGSVDGAHATLRLADNTYRATFYGGANVPVDLRLERWSPLKNNFIVGGQILTTALPQTRLGISYINRQRDRQNYWTERPDSLGNPIPFFVTPDPDKEQLLGGDVSVQLSDINLYGRYDYEVNFKKTQRGQLGVRYCATDDISVSGDFIHRAPRVPFNSFFAVFSPSTINEFEAGVDYTFIPMWRGFVRGAYVKYTDDESFRYTVGVAHTYAGITYRGNSGYAGELNALTLYGAYPLFERVLIPNASASYSSYRLNSMDNKEEAYAVGIGATVRPLQVLSLDLQGQWLRNRVV
ncbi:MAG: hypothetical protein HY708_08500, partial [Ignavibacteriae bacterium]|nr:hypothetical protein [Ignavibacteriota bacterium]